MGTLLAIETSTAACSIGIKHHNTVWEHHEVVPQQHANIILPWIDELLTRADLKLEQLDAICYGCGPGGFTGIRIGLGVVQGIALVHDLPVVPVSSLRVIAQQAYRLWKVEHVAVVQDAKMGQVYWGVYQLENALMQAVVPDTLSTPDAIAIPPGDWLRVGDVDAKVCYPHAAPLLTLAEHEFKLSNVLPAEEALPVYLRGKEAWGR